MRISTVFVGEVHPPLGDPDNLFTVHQFVPGDPLGWQQPLPYRNTMLLN